MPGLTRDEEILEQIAEALSNVAQPESLRVLRSMRTRAPVVRGQCLAYWTRLPRDELDPILKDLASQGLIRELGEDLWKLSSKGAAIERAVCILQADWPYQRKAADDTRTSS